MEHFNKELGNQEVYNKIPVLSDVKSFSRMKTNQLVKYIGFVQDALQQEYFGSFYVKDGRKKTTFFRDYVDDMTYDDMDEDNSSLAERNVFYCIPIPGQSPWTKSNQNQTTVENQEQSNKAKKRDRPDSDDEDLPSDESYGTGAKKRNTNQQRPEVEEKNATSVFNFGVPQDGVAAAIKVYEDVPFKLCDIVEVIGVLNFDAQHEFSQEIDPFGIQLDQLPSSIVPRIHVISYKRYDSIHDPFIKVPSESFLATLSTLRNDLVRYISKALKNDTLAAQYVLMNIISCIQVRSSGLTIGSFPLNISRADSSTSTALQKVIQQFVPACHLLPFSNDNLNKKRFQPFKNYETNRLEFGLLQVPKGTSVIIDECALSSGPLSEIGLKNFGVVESLLKFQILNYDFTFNHIEMESDVRVLVLSDAKSIFSKVTKCVVPIVQGPEVDTSLEINFDLARRCLALVSLINHNSKFSISEDVQKLAQSQFVAERKIDGNVDENRLHLWLVIARLLSLSFGKVELDTDTWTLMRQMEADRLDRVARLHRASSDKPQN
ncbi:hypothetical protein AKO1_014577 [Acrasis kona]|uniref:Mini-chromosome maintenance complex-binding protein n=1 Tax=Acrasis kona TaxID=1008807 RepID=A0AAW2Z2R6_9EUKA